MNVTNRKVGKIEVTLTAGYGTAGFGSVRVDMKLTLPLKMPDTDEDPEDIGKLQHALSGVKWTEALEYLIAQIKKMPGIADGKAISGEISATHPYISWSGSGVL